MIDDLCAACSSVTNTPTDAVGVLRASAHALGILQALREQEQPHARMIHAVGELEIAAKILQALSKVGSVDTTAVTALDIAAQATKDLSAVTRQLHCVNCVEEPTKSHCG